MLLRTCMFSSWGACMSWGSLLAQDPPSVRFLNASFKIAGANPELAQRMRVEFEGEFLNLIDPCLGSDTETVVDLQFNVTTQGSYNALEMLEFRNIPVRHE